MSLDRTARIQRLNDAFRQRLYASTIGELVVQGDLVVTAGVADQGNNFLNDALSQVRLFSDFTEDNDPYGEHDFGQFTLDGQKLFWKIDYYDVDYAFGSLDPSNPEITRRVLTVLLASEY